MYTYNTTALQNQYDDMRAQQAAIQAQVDAETDPTTKATLKAQLRTKKVAIANFARANRFNRIG